MSRTTSSPPLRLRPGERLEATQGHIPRIGEIRSQWLLPALVAASVLVFGGILYLTSYKNFFYDEWDFVTAYRPSQATSVLLPHNEHWSTIPILVWKVLFATVGLRSYIPYEALALAGHVACVIALFVLIRRYSGDLPAFAAALLLLVLGAGAMNIVYAFQLGWTLSIAFGLVAMLLASNDQAHWSPRRLASLSALLLGSLMSSGAGLGFLVAVTVQLLVRHSGRRPLLAVVLPYSAYLAWFLIYGAGIPGTPAAPCPSCPTVLGTEFHSINANYMASVANFIRFEFLATMGGLLGLTGHTLPILLVQLLFACVVGWLAWHWYTRGGIASWEVGLLCGLLTQLVLVGLVRARLGAQSAANPQYVYVGVVYLLPLIANAAKDLSWRRMWRPVWITAVAAVVLSNAMLLVDQAIGQRKLMTNENAELRVVELFRGAPDLVLDTPLDDVIMPQLTARHYYAAIDELGSPLPSTKAVGLDELPAWVVDKEMITLFGHAITATLDGRQPSTTSCQTIHSATAPSFEIQVPPGQTLVLTASQDAESWFYLGLLAPPTSRANLEAKLSARTPEWIHLPNTGRDVTWRLRVLTGPVGEIQICGGSNLRMLSS